MTQKFRRLSPSAMRDRTLNLVEKALQNLQDRGIKITKARLEKETKAIDPAGVGVNRTTFTRNEAVEALIVAVTGTSVVQPLHLDFKQVNISHLRAGRDARRTVREKLRKYDKVALALQVFALEEELIIQQQAMARQALAEIEARERKLLKEVKK